MKSRIYIFLGIFTIKEINAMEFLSELKSNTAILMRKDISYGSQVVGEVVQTHKINDYYIWYMNFILDFPSNNMDNYFLAFKPSHNTNHISIFKPTTELSINDIMEHKPIGLYYNEKTQLLIGIFIVQNTNDILMIRFTIHHSNNEGGMPTTTYKVTQVQSIDYSRFVIFLNNFLTRQVVVGTVFSSKDMEDLNNMALKININGETTTYILYIYNVHDYGACNEIMPIINKPVHLIIITLNKNNIVLTLKHYNSCCISRIPGK